MSGMGDARSGGCRTCSQHVPAQMPRTCRSFTALKPHAQEVTLLLLPSTPLQAPFLLPHHGVPVVLSQPGLPGASLPVLSCPGSPVRSPPQRLGGLSHSTWPPSRTMTWSLSCSVPRGLPRSAFPKPGRAHARVGWTRPGVCEHPVTCHPPGQPCSFPIPSCSLDGSEGMDKQTFPSGGCCSRARNSPATRLPRGSHSITRLWVMLEQPLIWETEARKGLRMCRVDF